MEKPNYLTWDDMEIGMEGPTKVFTVTAEKTEQYGLAVEDLNSLFFDEKIAGESEWGGRIAHPTTAAMYALGSPVLSDKVNPPGRVHAKQYYEFHRPARLGDVLTVRTVIADKYVKRERKYIVTETVAVDGSGRKIVTSRGTGIWPL